MMFNMSKEPIYTISSLIWGIMYRTMHTWVICCVVAIVVYLSTQFSMGSPPLIHKHWVLLCIYRLQQPFKSLWNTTDCVKWHKSNVWLPSQRADGFAIWNIVIIVIGGRESPVHSLIFLLTWKWKIPGAADVKFMCGINYVNEPGAWEFCWEGRLNGS